MAIAWMLLVLVSGVQDEGEARRPRRGDEVIARGCIAGAVLENADIKLAKGRTELVPPASFRMTGDKSLLKSIKEEHAGHADGITGVLKSDLPRDSRMLGGKVGNTSVGIGVVDPRAASRPPAIPVLEVKGIEHTEARCR